MSRFEQTSSLQRLFNRNALHRLLLNANGRISRQTYLVSLVVLAMGYAVLLFPAVSLAIFCHALGLPAASDFLFFCWFATFFYFFAVLTIKRLHDLSLSGWWSVGGLLPLLGTVPMFILLFLIRGTQGDNHFGAETQSF